MTITRGQAATSGSLLAAFEVITGAAFSRRALMFGALLLLGVLVAYPVAMLVYGSLAPDARSAGQASALSLSLQNYRNVLASGWFLATLANTAIISTGALAVSAVIGGFAAWTVRQTNAHGRLAIEVLSLAPIVLSSFVLAVGWRLLAAKGVGFFNQIAERVVGTQPFDIDTTAGIIFVVGIAHVPQMFIFVAAAMERLDGSLIEASRASGGGTWRTLRRIVGPVITPTLLSAALLIFMLNVATLVIPLLLGFSSGTFVLTTQLYVMTTTDMDADYGGAAALAVIVLVLSLLLLLLYWRMLGGRSFVTVGTKGFAPYRQDLGKWRWVPSTIIVPLLALSVLGPLIMMALTSLSPFMGAYWPLTTRNYEDLLQSSLFFEALFNSAVIVVVGPVLAVAFATVLAWIVVRSRMRGARLVELLTMTTLGVPAICIGFGMLLAWVHVPALWGSIWILIIALIGAWLAVALRAIVPAFMQVHPDLEESGLMSGMSILTTLRKITMPLVLPGIAGAWILLFVLFFRDVPTVIMLWRSGSMPMSVFMLQAGMNGDYPSVSALAMLETVLLALILLGFRAFIRRSGSRLERETLAQAH